MKLSIVDRLLFLGASVLGAYLVVAGIDGLYRSSASGSSTGEAGWVPGDFPRCHRDHDALVSVLKAPPIACRGPDHETTTLEIQ